MDGIVEVLGLEHRRLQDAVEVDDLSGGHGVPLFPSWQSLKGKKEPLYIGAGFSPFSSSVPFVYAVPAEPLPNFPLDLRNSMENFADRQPYVRPCNMLEKGTGSRTRRTLS